MSKPRFFASLISASLLAATVSVVSATPQAPTPPPAPVDRPLACTKTGDIIFQSTTKLFDAPHHKSGAALPVITVYDTGGWTLVETQDGKQTRAASGCLARDQLATIRDDMRTAPWKTTHYEVTCAAIGSVVVEYSSHGKLLWTDVVCGNVGIDDVSRKKLDEIKSVLERVTKPSELQTGGHKPS